MIIILNGSCGVGKSTVAQVIASKLERSVHIRGDDLRNLVFDAKINEEQNMLVDRNVLSLVRNYNKSNYCNIIIDNVYENKQHLETLTEEIRKIDPCIYVFRLYVSLEENIKRNAGRKKESIMEESRVRELYEVFRGQGDSVGKVIDSSKLSVDETAGLILQRIKERL